VALHVPPSWGLAVVVVVVLDPLGGSALHLGWRPQAIERRVEPCLSAELPALGSVLGRPRVVTSRVIDHFSSRAASTVKVTTMKSRNQTNGECAR
jgi:hypothetical protein